jgi:hypothetical protein
MALPFVRVGQFIREAGSKYPCKWVLAVGIYTDGTAYLNYYIGDSITRPQGYELYAQNSVDYPCYKDESGNYLIWFDASGASATISRYGELSSYSLN